MTSPIPTWRRGCSPATTGSTTTAFRRTSTATARTWPARSPRPRTASARSASPQAGLIPLRVLGANGAGWGSDVAAAFDWAGDRGVRIVNASLGSDRITTAERLAIREHPGTLYVVAAGNDGEER